MDPLLPLSRGYARRQTAASHVYKYSLPGAGIGSNVAPAIDRTYATSFYWYASTEWIASDARSYRRPGDSIFNRGRRIFRAPLPGRIDPKTAGNPQWRVESHGGRVIRRGYALNKWRVVPVFPVTPTLRTCSNWTVTIAESMRYMRRAAGNKGVQDKTFLLRRTASTFGESGQGELSPT